MKNKKNNLKDLLHGTLSEEQESKLYYSENLRKKQEREWNLAAKNNCTEFDSDACYQKVATHLWGTTKIQPLWKQAKVYWAAASLTIGILASTLFWKSQDPEVLTKELYVWTNGQQHIAPITLPDGTEVLLGANSKLTYPKYFSEDERKIELYGQGFFNVAQDTNHPFIVVTPQMEVTALGTAFEIFSYGENSVDETTLLSGKIKVAFPNARTNKKSELILQPNQKASLKNNQVQVEAIDAERYLNWKNDKNLSFVNEKLAVIIPRLEKWYNKKIVCDPSIAETSYFTFSVDTDSFSDFAKYIHKVSNLRIHKTNNIYSITKR